MESKKPQTSKKFSSRWIVLIVIVLLSGGFGVYTLLERIRPAPIVQPTVVRGKIPMMPASAPANAMDEPSAAKEPLPTSGAPAITVVHPPESRQVDAATGDAKAGAEREEPGSITTQSAPGPASEDSTTAKPMETATTDPPASIPYRSDNRSAPISPDVQAQEAASGNSERAAAFAIQVGAYREIANADQMVAQLRKKGYDAYMSQRSDKKGQTWHLVRYGDFQDRTAAAQALAAFKEREHLDAGIAVTHAK